jgi:hypothetical protein
MQYVIYIHTHSCQNGFLHKGFIGDNKPPIFNTQEQAQEYINKQCLGWRWSGYCTIREYKGEFENEQNQNLFQS